ncbi:MAG: hypothetical protein J6Y26_05405 [Lachnospiraceae bacterium]|nr:hypothetical protein [Lachnospiraceae bacterium]
MKQQRAWTVYARHHETDLAMVIQNVHAENANEAMQAIKDAYGNAVTVQSARETTGEEEQR